MTDKISPKQRSINMSRIRSKNTAPELYVRSILYQHGYRFRLHVKKLPGSPDVVLPKYNTVIFVHGCFWHHHSGCRKAYIPKQNYEFWQDKFSKNMQRDQKNYELLKKLGWKIFVVWECQLELGLLTVISFLNQHKKNSD